MNSKGPTTTLDSRNGLPGPFLSIAPVVHFWETRQHVPDVHESFTGHYLYGTNAFTASADTCAN